jgi:peptide/nickel transport system ATP-binding protein
MNVMEVNDLRVQFRLHGGGRLRAVDGLSLTLRAGQTVALVGESGSGKSTVVRALSRLIKPNDGTITIDGAPAPLRGGPLRAYRHRVAIVFQDPFASLNGMHTVRHHLARPLLLHDRRLSRGDLDQRIHDLLTSVSLSPADEFARKRPHELSGGQRQRVAIARALATSPNVLLADEPVSMLDVSIRLDILNLLDTLKRERDLALLYVTHDLATARHFASEILVMYRGEIVERGPSDEVILRPAHPYTRQLADAAPDPTLTRAQLAQARHARTVARAARLADTRMAGAAADDPGCRFQTRCPFAMDVCATRPPDRPAGAAGHHARCWLPDPRHTTDPTPPERENRRPHGQ